MDIRLPIQSFAPLSTFTQECLKDWLSTTPDALGMSTQVIHDPKGLPTITPHTFCWFMRDGIPTPEHFRDHTTQTTAALSGILTQDPVLLLTAQHYLEHPGANAPPQTWSFLVVEGGGLLCQPSESFVPLEHTPTQKQSAQFKSRTEDTFIPLLHRTSAHQQLATRNTLLTLTHHLITKSYTDLFHTDPPEFTIQFT